MTKLYLLAVLLSVGTAMICRPGEKSNITTNGTNVCNPCDDGTFMPVDKHKIAQCNNCTVCEVGLEIQPCQPDMDAVCCKSDEYVHVSSSGSKACKMRTQPCKQGQLFIVSTDKCASCPPNTYMIDNHHNKTTCDSCLQLQNNHEFDGYVARVCNITRSSTSEGKCSQGLGFHCSDLPEVHKNKTYSVTGRTDADAVGKESISKIAELVISSTGVLVLLVILVNRKWSSSLMTRLKIKVTLLVCRFIVLCFFVIWFFSILLCLATLLVGQPENSLLSIANELFRLIALLCTFALIITIVLQEIVRRTDTQKCTNSPDRDDEDEASTDESNLCWPV